MIAALADALITVLAVAGVIGLVAGLVWLPARLVRGLNAPKRLPDEDENDLTHWT